MRFRSLFVVALALTTTLELPAQGRRRFRRPDEAAPPPATEETKPETAKPKKPKAYLAIVGGDVYLGTGQRLTGATVLVADDKIEAVGHNLRLPEGTVTIDAKGRCVSPGFVAIEGYGMGVGRSGPFADSTNPFDPTIKQGLAAGITAFCAGNKTNRGKPGGQNAVIKLAWADVDGMVLKEDSVCGIVLPLNPTEREQLLEAIQEAKDYLKALAEFPATKAKDEKAQEPKMPRGGEKIVAVLRGEVPLWVASGGGGFNPFARRGAAEQNDDLEFLRQAVDLARTIGHGVVIEKPISAWLLADEIAGTGSMVAVNPRNHVPPDPKDPDRTGTNIAMAAILAEAGVPVAVTCPSGMFGGPGVGTMGILGQDLNTPQIDAAFAVRGGLDSRKALRTITLDAARQIGVGDRIGSLEPGKDADILILDGDPMHYATFVITALVNGKVVYEKSRESLFQHVPAKN